MDATLYDPLVGRVLDDRYVVESRIARGGMATVYLAVDRRLEREVAVKVMHAGLAHDEDFVRRFIREARSAARLSHPHVVAVYDQGEDDGTLFLAMEHVPGRTLRDLLAERGRLTPREAFTVLEPVLDALAAAHRAGLVHRDVKPENVLLADDGRVKVADFGLARAMSAPQGTTSTGIVMGTVAYLSPEQVERGVADPRSDVYAAGILLFEMLTGTKPYDGETAMQVAYRHVNDSVPAPSSRVQGVPEELDDLVALATARDPDERPADGGQLLALTRRTRRELSPAALDTRPVALDDTLETGVPTARSSSVAEPTQALLRPVGDGGGAAAVEGRGQAGDPGRADTSRRRRRRGRYALVSVLVLALVLGAVGWWVGAGPGAYTEVPRVQGVSQQVAEQRLSAAGLRADVEQTFSETVPRGTVVSSTPRDGGRVRKSGTVTLAVSKGPERYEVPALAGRTLAFARTALPAAQLTVGEVTERYDEKVAKGSVISTSPSAGTELRRGQAVALVVSRGRKPIAVQDFTGKPAEQARAALTKAGFTVRSSERFDERVPAGAVVSQDPRSGTAYKGDTVTLVVSKGPPLVAVPDVVGKNVAEARRLLQAAGFKVTVTQVFGGYFGTVRFQDPAGGGQAPKGSTVTLTVI